MKSFLHSISATLCLGTIAASLTTLSAQQPGTSPVKIFILAGQSNMVGQGNMTPATAVNTLEHLVDPVNDTAGAYQFLVDGENWRTWDDVWIDYLGRRGSLTTGYGTTTSHVGPEIGFGYMASGQYENQVLIIKCAWGGKSLGLDFLPPSAASYPPPQGEGDKGFYYAEILRLVSQVTGNLGTYFPGYAGQGFEIAGFGWHQGWNDRVDANFSAAYETNMAHFIRDMRSSDKGLDVPGLPFVIVTTAMDGNGPAAYTQVELAQRAMVEPQLTDPSQPDRYDDFIGNVAVVDARQTYNGLQFWFPANQSPVSEGYHWNRNAKTYVNIGLAMGDAMAGLSPGRGPSRLRAAGVASGIELTWQNGLETPTSVLVKRNGVEIAAAAPVSPVSFIDTTALPGIHTYELTFTMPGDPCDPLTLTFNGSINRLLAFRSPGGIGLSWENPMTYAGIEVRRDGELLEANLPGTATGYTDTAPPASGIITYTVSPTTGTSTTASAQINLSGLPSGSALIYEPFDYAVGGLDAQSGISEVGLTNTWQANSTTLVTAGTLSYGSLPVGGGKLSDFNGGVNRFIGTRGINASALAAQGMLNDGATLWFSVLLGYDAGGNRTNTRLAFILGDESQSTGNNTYYMNSPGTTGIGVNLGNVGHIQPYLMTDQNTPNQAGSSPGPVLPSSTTNVDYKLVVGRVTWGATQDTLDLFLPGTDLVLPSSVHSSLTVNVDQSGYDTLSMARGDKVVLDEIRFGASYESVIGADVTPDNDPPSPNPAGFASAPAADGDSATSMTAQTGTDASGPVEYLFTETSNRPGGTSSAWQTSPSYTDDGLNPSTQYTYTVTMRDRLGNTGPASDPASAMTAAADTTAPTPTPMTWVVAPTPASSTEITMTANTATDPSGVEYYFTCTSGGGNDSGWRDSPVYTDAGLTPSTAYAYEVKARDKSLNHNETTASSPPASATTDDPPTGPGAAVACEPFDYPAGALGSASGGTGWSGNWSSNSETKVTASDLTYGNLDTTGGSIGNLAGNINRFGASRTIDLSTPGLLANGKELWFSLMVGYDTGGNRTNSRLALVLGTQAINTANGTDYTFTTDTTGLGVTFGRFGSTNGNIVAARTNNADIVYGTGSDGSNPVVPAATNTTVDYAFVVGRITWGTDSDTIDLFLPDANLNLGSVHSTLTTNVDQSGYDTISFKRGDKVVMDEIRFGATFEGVIGAGAPASGYATWSGGATADGDSNNDGVLNGIAWALGASDPNENAIGLLPTLDHTSDADYLIFAFDRADAANEDPDTTIDVEYGNHLAGWNTAVHDGDNILIGITEGSPTDIVEVKLKRTTLGADGRIFVRLKVSVTP